MVNIIIPEVMSAEEKIIRMQNDACFDLADSRDTSDIVGQAVRTAIKSTKAPPNVPKVFLTNNCSFNCAYCGCRVSNEKSCYVSSPKELAKIAVDGAKARGSGIFLTSAIYKNSNYTQELIIETLKCIRNEHDYKGYVHAKVMPGADKLLICETGKLADRLSVNIEVAQSEAYNQIAKQKNKGNILTPMGDISELIRANKQDKRSFATSQTTQLMAGAAGETDRKIITLSKALYKKYNMQRVYYTSFYLPPVQAPIWRKYRLYQADRLLQLYNFQPDEIAPENEPDLSPDIDPKAAWALRNIHLFPIEINNADYFTLLRVPGIGEVSARRIIAMRRYGVINAAGLVKTGVRLKKSASFITIGGKYLGGNELDKPYALRKKLETPQNQITQLSFW